MKNGRGGGDQDLAGFVVGGLLVCLFLRLRGGKEIEKEREGEGGGGGDGRLYVYKLRSGKQVHWNMAVLLC